MNAQHTESAFYVGQPVVFGDMANPDKTGWIAKIDPKPSDMKTYTLGGGGMVQEFYDVTIAWENRTLTKTSEGIIARWAEKAASYALEPIGAPEALAMLADAEKAQAEAYAERQKESERARQALSDWRDSIRDKIPADAKAVLIGELEEDDCDLHTDYFNTKTSRTVILGFSTHTRDLFPEMRKAAANYEHTAHLTDAPSSAEHREKYSMGAGYYLKAANRYSTGWKVSKRGIYMRGNDIAESIPAGEWHVPEDQPMINGPKPEQKRAAPADAQTVGEFTIEEHTHTKRGFQMWIVSPVARVERDTFTEWLAKAKERKGWYSRKWGTTPAGFAFKDQNEAEAFAQELAQ